MIDDDADDFLNDFFSFLNIFAGKERDVMNFKKSNYYFDIPYFL